MKQKITFCLVIVLCVFGSFFSYIKSTGTLYEDYKNLSEYRRLHPETLPNVEVMRFFIAGHETTYADSLWIALIQYIGDNIFNGKLRIYTNPMVDRISTLHPYFTKPYNIALILSPTMKDEIRDKENDREILAEAIRLSERGIEKNCDPQKIAKIRSWEYGPALWQDPTIRNPCRDDMIAYNMAYGYSELGDKKNAKIFYMIASAQKEAPEASRFLAVLADAREGEHMKAAESFLLTAIEGYDEGASCRSSALELIKEIKAGESLEEIVQSAKNTLTQIHEPKDLKNPLAQSSTNCYNSTRRSIKQIYLAYITDEAKKAPEATTSIELAKAGVLRDYPTLPEQRGYGLVKKNNIWNYQVHN